MAGFSFIGSPAFLFVGMGVFDIFADGGGMMQLWRSTYCSGMEWGVSVRWRMRYLLIEMRKPISVVTYLFPNGEGHEAKWMMCEEEHMVNDSL